jgi:hypothetical protein
VRKKHKKKEKNGYAGVVWGLLNVDYQMLRRAREGSKGKGKTKPSRVLTVFLSIDIYAYTRRGRDYAYLLFEDRHTASAFPRNNQSKGWYGSHGPDQSGVEESSR